MPPSLRLCSSCSVRSLLWPNDRMAFRSRPHDDDDSDEEAAALRLSMDLFCSSSDDDLSSDSFTSRQPFGEVVQLLLLVGDCLAVRPFVNKLNCKIFSPIYVRGCGE